MRVKLWMSHCIVFEFGRISRVYRSFRYRGMLFFGSSLSLARPPNRNTLLPMRVKLWPRRGQGWGPFLGGFGFSFFHSHLEACSSYRSLLYLPYSTIPPNTRILVPSTTKPKAAHPGGISPLTGGTNHWLVAVL